MKVFLFLVSLLCLGCQQKTNDVSSARGPSPAPAPEAKAERSVESTVEDEDEERGGGCEDMTRNQRLAICGPASGQEVWPMVMKRAIFIGVAFRFSGDCFSSISENGETSFVPPLEAKCFQGPRKQCVRTEEPKEPWEYRFPADEPAWAKLVEHGWKVRDDAWTHIRVSWEKKGEECIHRVRGVADMDGDGVYSTYEVGGVSRGDEVVRDLESVKVPE